jgi:hypothetical protein
MRRVPYQIILPVVQLALYLVLVWLGCYYRPTWQAQFQHWIAPRPAADTVGWDPVWIDGPPSLAEQIAFGINTPAALASSLVLVPFGSFLHNGASRELAAHTTTAILIPALGFFIGRRLERQSIVTARPSMIGKAYAVATLGHCRPGCPPDSGISGSPPRRASRWPPSDTRLGYRRNSNLIEKDLPLEVEGRHKLTRRPSCSTLRQSRRRRQDYPSSSAKLWVK